jgi:hypothetical protein
MAHRQFDGVAACSIPGLTTATGCSIRACDGGHLSDPDDRSVASEAISDLLPIAYKRFAEEWGVHASHEDCIE